MKNILLISTCLVLCVACVSSNNYGIGFRSELSYKVTETRLYDDNVFFAGAGTLVSGSDFYGTQATYSNIRTPLPEKLELSWKEPDGTIKKVPVVLKGKIPKHLRAQIIILTITETGEVEVSLEKDIQVW